MSYNKIVKINTVDSQKPCASILLIYTGGTLGMAYGTSGSLEPFDFKQILEKVPALQRLDVQLSLVSFTKLIDSSNVKPGEWIEIGDIISAHYNDFDGFVVLHGTDTMAYSASALSFMLDGLNKPVIFTGAQLPIGALRSDARENLITAIEIASARRENGPIISEVCIYFHNCLLRGNRSKKVQSIQFDAFESENYPVLAEAGVTIEYDFSAIKPHKKDVSLNYQKDFDSSVVILKLFPGITSLVVSNILKIEGLKGVVLETFGSGNAPTESWFLDLIRKAVDKGIVF